MVRPFVVVILSTLAFSAHAWFGLGHMTVAAIAYDNLDPTVRTKVVKLLKKNPLYSQWIAGVAPQDRDKVAFMKAATWPDAIKQMKAYQNDGDKPNGPNVARNIGYKDMLMHKYWHFVDVPFSPDGAALEQPPVPNAKTQIAAFRKKLASKSASADVKSYDLVWLEHVVGDVHQPLHATSRFTQGLPHGDAGGNLVHLCAAPCKNELHALWDGAPGTSDTVAAALTLASQVPAVDPKLAAVSDESVWIDESFNIAKQSVYVAPIGVGAGPFTADATYRATAHDISMQRIALAGKRLANLLNDALK